MAPDFERLARMPCPIASLASLGTRLFNSTLAFSCCRNAVRVWRKTAANSAQALDKLISTTRMASATRYDKLARNYFSSLCLVAALVFWL
jgi:hypothetical protein